MKPIVKAPHPAITTLSKPVKKIDKKIKALIADLKDTLIHADNPRGVGLAAPQLGVNLRIFVTKPSEKDQVRAFINPRFTRKSKIMLDGIPERKKHKGLEGCLSIRSIWGKVKRHKSVTLKFLDESGKKQTGSFTGFMAVLIQHEMDHLDGILFTHRVLEQNGTLYRPGKNDKGKGILEPFKI